MSWEDWLSFIDDAGMWYGFDASRGRPHILMRDGPSASDRIRRFKERENVISYLRRHSRVLLKRSHVLQANAEFIVGLLSKGHRVPDGSTLVNSAMDHPEAEDMCSAHCKESQRRYRYFWPSDLTEAARLWRDESTYAFPFDLEDYVEKTIAEMRAAQLVEVIEAEGTTSTPRRKRL